MDFFLWIVEQHLWVWQGGGSRAALTQFEPGEMNGSGVQSRQPQAALEYLSSVQSKFLSRFLAVLLPSSLLLVPFTQRFHSRIAGHGKTHQHKAGGIYVANNLIF